jgi:probable rRNA maturation factor
MPRSPYAIDWYVDPKYDRHVLRRSLGGLARRALAGEAVQRPATLSVAVVDNRKMKALNRRFRGIDAVTDVLSFPLGQDEDGAEVGGPTIGEVIIAFPTARQRAASVGESVSAELAHLLVHGVLHIVGYDHERPKDAARMRAREEALLGRAAH